MKIRPRAPRTKEELLKDMKSNAVFLERMKFVREVFYPALCDAAQNVEDADILLTGFNNVIMESFLARMKEVRVGEMNLEEKLDAQAVNADENKKLLELFKDMNVMEAKEYIEGMKAEIGTFKRDYFEKTLLKDLPTKWIDEL